MTAVELFVGQACMSKMPSKANHNVMIYGPVTETDYILHNETFTFLGVLEFTIKNNDDTVFS